MKEKGRMFVISGPSGAGKSTVVFKAIEAVSYTHLRAHET